MPLIKKSSKKPIIVNSIDDMENPKKGLDPVINTDCKILILGTFPGKNSLEFSKYYNDSTNRFWPIMSEIFDLYGPYENKINTLIAYGVGIWDIFAYAQRKGSSDNKIEKAMYNDILGLSKKYMKLKILAFNGKNAYEWLKNDHPGVFEKYECIRLQSTSGLNANFNNGQDWKILFRSVLL